MERNVWRFPVEDLIISLPCQQRAVNPTEGEGSENTVSDFALHIFAGIEKDNELLPGKGDGELPEEEQTWSEP